MHGCPDRDNDGIADTDDACPDDKGTLQFKGCADTDGDGIADNVDACPTEKGNAANHGCPEIDQKNIEFISSAAHTIKFESETEKLKTVSFSKLDSIALIIKKYGNTKWRINVYTENVNSKINYIDLAKRRATAIKSYFIDKGIDKSRLSSAGYIDTKPVKKNTSSKNFDDEMRIEISLVK